MKYINPYICKPANKISINCEVDFIGKRKFGKVLDIGEENTKGKLLKKYYNIKKMENTNGDLDVIKLSGLYYDEIFCFEVLEHLFNPLHLLLQIKKVMGINSILYLSVPKHRPYFLKSSYHYNEFYKVDLINLIKRAGLTIVKFKTIRRRKFWKHFLGVRLFLRLFFDRTYFLRVMS